MNTLSIVLPLPKLIKKQLSSLYYGLPNVEWIETYDLCITLVHLGPIDGTLQLDVQDVLAKLRFPPFDLNIQNIGYYPSKKNSRVIWAGVSQTEQLTQLIKIIITNLTGLVPKIEQKKVEPHVFLGEYETIDKKRLADYFDSYSKFTSNSFTNDAFVLLKSRKTITATTIYQELARYKMMPPVNKLRILPD